jgi:hypothetical protein
MRISELQREERLLIIEEARLLRGKDYVDICIEDDATISELVIWSDTRQGHKYWSLIESSK